MAAMPVIQRCRLSRDVSYPEIKLSGNYLNMNADQETLEPAAKPSIWFSQGDGVDERVTQLTPRQ